MSLTTIIDDLISKANNAFGVIDGKLRGKAEKTEVYTRAYLDNPVNTLGANAATASQLKAARLIALGGDAQGSAGFDGSANITLLVTVPELANKADKLDTLTPAEIDSRIQAVISTAPAALDTLKELADALGNDPNFAGTITTELAKKANVVDVYTMTAADAKFLTKNGKAADTTLFAGKAESHFATKTEHDGLSSDLSSALQQLATAFQNGADKISGVGQ